MASPGVVYVTVNRETGEATILQIGVGDRVRIKSLGRDITPSEWVGLEGVVRYIAKQAERKYYVLLDGETTPTRFWISELEPALVSPGAD